MTRIPAFAALLVAAAAGASGDFAYVRSAPKEDGVVVVDTRPLADCRAKSLAGARCLPADDFLGPHRRLPDARDILWLLGTAGLSGGETVLVVGQDPTARDFVAGLLWLAGQRSVQVLALPVAHVLDGNAAPGRERGMIREAVFEAPMRDGALVLRDELRAMRPAPMLLDGRPEGEYWGEAARTARTGHLPGAVSLPALRLRSSTDPASATPLLPEASAHSPVAYAHDAYEGLAYLTLLVAGHGVGARLYAEGFAEWAADGSLPLDAAGYPERAVPAAAPLASPPSGATSSVALLAATVALTLAAFASGFWFARRRAA